MAELTELTVEPPGRISFHAVTLRLQHAWHSRICIITLAVGPVYSSCWDGFALVVGESMTGMQQRASVRGETGGDFPVAEELTAGLHPSPALA